MSAEVNLLDFDSDGLAALMAAWGEKAFRARQLMHWIHQNGCGDFSLMTDIAKVLREKLQRQAHISAPRVLSVSDSVDGTQKWLFDVDQGNAVEAVFIPERGRGTLCISTQAGCALDCAFCSTGKQGFNRNLAAAEIIGQLWAVNHSLLKQYTTDAQMAGRPVTNVVFMGMGEPLANFDNVVTALNVMISDHAYGVSRRRLTVSTSGIAPAIDRLRDVCPVALAVSLHAPDDALRDELVPINRKYPLKDLMEACRRYLEKAPRDFITFEYVMLDGVNDGDQEIRQLIRLTRNIPCKFNLIPFNPFPGTFFRCSSPERISHFMDQLMRAGKVTTVRRTRGDDVDAACGQLAGRIKDKSKRTLRLERVE